MWDSNKTTRDNHKDGWVRAVRKFTGVLRGQFSVTGDTHKRAYSKQMGTLGSIHRPSAWGWQHGKWLKTARDHREPVQTLKGQGWGG